MNENGIKMRSDARLVAVVMVAVAGLSWAPALANPVGPQVASGRAGFRTEGNVLTVTNTPGTIINWQGFSIRSDEITRFMQQNSTSSVLNRVTGGDPSSIYGQLQSNGRVFLINPNGILFGPGGKVDVNGLVASTLALSDDDFLAGRLSFATGSTAGAVRNAGTITTPAGGNVWLIAPQVENSGLISSPDGSVMLAAGRSISLVDPLSPDIAVVLSAPDDAVVNLGEVVSRAGKIGIFGGLISQKGVVSADSAVVGEKGRIALRASREVAAAQGSTISASGPAGGEVVISAAEGDTLVAGAVRASGTTGKGGRVHLLGGRVGLFSGGSVDVSGSGGGEVLMGGDYQGKNSLVQNAQYTFLDRDATISADGGDAGNGGRVILWSNNSTQAYGGIKARGGLSAGDGGFVEVSGKRFLDFAGSVDTSAPAGATGTLLLDPTAITVGITTPTLTPPVFFSTPDAGANVVSAALISSATTNVVLQAETDITFSQPIAMFNPGVGLIAQAGRDIVVNSTIQTLGGAVTLRSNDPGAVSAGVTSGGITIAATGGVSTNGGVITLSSYPGASGSNGGSITINGPLDSGGGNILLNTGKSISGAGNIVGSSLVANGVQGVSLTGANSLAGSLDGSGFSFDFNSATNLNLGLISASGGVVRIRTNSSSIMDGNGTADNVTGAFRVDFNDAVSVSPGGAGSFADPIEIRDVGPGGLTGRVVNGGLFVDNVGGALAIGGIAHVGASPGDIFVRSAADTTIDGSIVTTGSTNTGNVVVETTGNLTVNAGVNKAGTGSLRLRASGGDLLILGNVIGNGNTVALQTDGAVSGSGGVSGATVNVTAANGISLFGTNAGNVVNLANTTTGDITFKSSNILGTAVSATNGAPGGTLTVEESAGDLTVSAGGIIAGGPVWLMTQKPNGVVTVNGSIDTRPAGGSGSMVDIRGDNLALNAPVWASGLSITNVSPDVAVDLGGPDATGVLGLSGAEFGMIAADVIRIGDGGTGPITVTSPITTPAALSLVSGSDILQNPLATIGSTSLQANGASVNLPEANTAGVIAGEAGSGDFIYRSTSPIVISTVDGTSGLFALGNIKLSSDGFISQPGGPIEAAGLALETPGSVFLQDPLNFIGVLAADLDRGGSGSGSFAFDNASSTMEIGSVLGTSGIRTNNQPLKVTTAGDLAVRAAVAAGTGDVKLQGSKVVLESGDIIANRIFLIASDPGGAGSISVTGPTAPNVAAADMMELVADSFSFAVAPRFVSGPMGIAIKPFSDNRPITVGAACASSPCLLLDDLTFARFNAPSLRIGSDVATDPNTAGDITIVAPLSRSGHLAFLSGGKIQQSASADIAVNSLGLSGSSVLMPAANPVGVVAGIASSGEFYYRSSNLLTLSQVPGISGITAAGNIWLESDSPAGINQVPGAGVRTAGGVAFSAVGPVMLDDPGNNVRTVAADVSRGGTGSGSFTFRNSADLGIGLVSVVGPSGVRMVEGITTNNRAVEVAAGGAVGTLSVGASVNAGNDAVTLTGPNVLLRSNSVVDGSDVWIAATGAGGSGNLGFSGPIAPVIKADVSVELEADNLVLSINPVISVSPLSPGNQIMLHPYSNQRPVTVGSACSGGSPCLLLPDVSSAIFNSPTLVIGQENILGGSQSQTFNVAGDITIAAPIVRTGRLGLLSGGNITQSASIDVPDLGIVTPGSVVLEGANTVDHIAGVVGSLSFNDLRSLGVVSVKAGVMDPVDIHGLSASGPIFLTSAGTVTLLAPVSSKGTVSLNAPNGAITDATIRTVFPSSIMGSGISLTAAHGIGGPAGMSTETAALSASNTIDGGIDIVNRGSLTLGTVKNAGLGAVSIDNAGAMVSAGPITTSGTLSLVAHSPLTIGAGGITAAADIILTAAASGAGDNLTVDGKVTSTAGSITASAGNTVIGKANLSAAKDVMIIENINSGTPTRELISRTPPLSSEPLPLVEPVIEQIISDVNKDLPAIVPEERLILSGEVPAPSPAGEAGDMPVSEGTSGPAAPADEEEQKRRSEGNDTETAKEGEPKHEPVRTKQYCN